MFKNRESSQLGRAPFNELGKIIDNIKSSCLRRNFSFRFVPRKGNKVMHFLAHFALYVPELEIWDWVISTFDS